MNEQKVIDLAVAYNDVLRECNKLLEENKKLKEFVQDCSVSHIESRYKYRAQVLMKETE